MTDDDLATARAEAARLRSALERVVAEVSKPTDPDEESWAQDAGKPHHWLQEALASDAGRAALEAVRTAARALKQAQEASDDELALNQADADAVNTALAALRAAFPGVG